MHDRLFLGWIAMAHRNDLHQSKQNHRPKTTSAYAERRLRPKDINGDSIILNMDQAEIDFAGRAAMLAR